MTLKLQGEWPLEDERMILADTCAKSFWHFLRYQFGVTLNTELGGWLSESHHRALCDWIQRKVYDEWIVPKKRGERLRSRKKLIICWPRHHGKTVINKALQMWIALHLPEASILNGSYSADKSQKVLRAIRALYEGTDQYGLFAWCYGIWYNPERTWTDAGFVHAARRGTGRSEASNYTCSIETGATGDHPDVYMADDLISGDKMKVDSDNHVRTAVHHMVRMIPVVLPGGLTVIWGTRYSDADVIGDAVFKEGVYEVAGMTPSDNRIRPEKGGAWAMHYLEADMGDDEDGYPIPTVPECITREDLKAWRDRDPQEYAAQAKNRPDVGGHQPLTREAVEEMKVDRLPDPKDVALYVHTDTAFRHAKRQSRSDHSVMLVFAHYTDGSGDVRYIDGMGHQHWKSDQFYNLLYNLVRKWDRLGYRVRGITDELESGGKGGTAQQTIKNKFVQRNEHYPGYATRCPPVILIQRQSGPAKTNRMLDAAGYWQSGHVTLYRQARGVNELTDQMLRLRMTAHDDWADAAADTFSGEVYRHARDEMKKLNRGWPVRKGDDVLQNNGWPTDQEACRLYDEYEDQIRGRGRAGWVREPIQ